MCAGDEEDSNGDDESPSGPGGPAGRSGGGRGGAAAAAGGGGQGSEGKAKRPSRRDKSLGVLSQKFVRLFLHAHRGVVSENPKPGTRKTKLDTRNYEP